MRYKIRVEYKDGAIEVVEYNHMTDHNEFFHFFGNKPDNAGYRINKSVIRTTLDIGTDVIVSNERVTHE